MHLILIFPQSNCPDSVPLTRSKILTVFFLLGILLELPAPVAHGQEFEASSFVLRNHSPFSAIIGIPGRWPDGTNNIAELSWNVSSHSFYENDGAESLLLDGETQTISARLQHRFSSRIQLGADENRCCRRAEMVCVSPSNSRDSAPSFS